MTVICSPTPEHIRQAARYLQRDKLVAFGTETVYGLGGNATSTHAVEKIYKAKGRPQHNPLIAHFSSLKAAQHYVQFNRLALTLAQHFWPGPLTLILPRTENCTICPKATNHLPNIAVRVPATPITRQLIQASQHPIVAPSANRSGKISPTSAQDVYRDLNGKIDLIIDTGPCPVGVESTVIDLSNPNHPLLLRPGGVTIEALKAYVPTLQERKKQHPATRSSPGLSRSHYAPNLPVRLNACEVNNHEALLAFGHELSGAAISFNLSRKKDLNEAAARLYEGLHQLDAKGRQMGLRDIAVQPLPKTDIGHAITDRLQRAAAPRPKIK